MDKPEVSVIVPIYNTEKYLVKCIDSIINQTFKNLELILINDGSTDKSLDICKKYTILDDRIRLINKKNQGSSHSRNIGISEAKGKYICFVDSDDWVKSDMLEKKINLIERYKVDIVISGMFIDKVDELENVRSQINSYKFSIWNTVDEVKDNIINLFKNALINSSCNKLYRLELLRTVDAKFQDTNIGEDTLFNLNIIKHIKGLVITDEAYYHYMRYKDNITLTRSIEEDTYEKYIHIHNEMEALFNHWGNKNEKISMKINEAMFCQYYSNTLKILNADKNLYCYKYKKKILDRGLKEKIILDTFNYNQSFSYKEKILRNIIKKRLYILATILLKIGKIKEFIPYKIRNVL